MRRIVLIFCNLAMVLVMPNAPTATAVDGPTGEYTIVDKEYKFGPGMSMQECFEVPAATQLTVIAASNEGRTGETAHLLFMTDAQNARLPVYLSTNLSADNTISTHRAAAGSYCYFIQVSDTQSAENRANQDPGVQPYKQVLLKIISTPLTN